MSNQYMGSALPQHLMNQQGRGNKYSNQDVNSFMEGKKGEQKGEFFDQFK